MDRNEYIELSKSLTRKELISLKLMVAAKKRANSIISNKIETTFNETNILSLASQKFIISFSHLAETLLRFPYWSIPAQIALVYSLLFVAITLIVPFLQQISPYLLFTIYIWTLNALLYGSKPLHNRMMKR